MFFYKLYRSIWSVCWMVALNTTRNPIRRHESAAIEEKVSNSAWHVFRSQIWSSVSIFDKVNRTMYQIESIASLSFPPNFHKQKGNIFSTFIMLKIIEGKKLKSITNICWIYFCVLSPDWIQMRSFNKMKANLIPKGKYCVICEQFYCL